ncbi:Release factor glutamine methyltransferase [Tenacibaculum litopenaei]|uniref:peptide chain release factor N(5)-glutamine methyltransferase n=1 Tax=Tenacibaculum litopenaei TaxID=396016 RepID=UPI00389530B5
MSTPMQTIKEYQAYFKEELTELFPATEIQCFFQYLLEHYTPLRPIDLVMNPTSVFTPEQLKHMQQALERLKKQEPVQHIIGSTEFYGRSFKVTPATLIPRPETEELITWIIESVPAATEASILDIGTGTGCIPITLKKELPNTTVSAIDISEQALQIAKENAEKHAVDINFIQKDILNSSTVEVADIIVSNPPYVRMLEKKEINDNVLHFEPHTALFVSDEDPLIFYRKICELASQHLRPGGYLFFEINQYLGAETLKLVTDFGFSNALLKKDIFENDRMIRAQWL